MNLRRRSSVYSKRRRRRQEDEQQTEMDDMDRGLRDRPWLDGVRFGRQRKRKRERDIVAGGAERVFSGRVPIGEDDAGNRPAVVGGFAGIAARERFGTDERGACIRSAGRRADEATDPHAGTGVWRDDA